MRGWIGWLLLVICLLVAIAGFRNAKAEPETEALAREVVCSVGIDCVVMSDRPHTVRTDIVRRRYQWTTSSGQVAVTCTRRLVFAGTWSCKAARGEL